MAAAGTLLQDLDSSSSGGDGDLVQKILADMNIPTTSSSRPVPPPMPSYTPVQHEQMGVGNTQMTMDSQIPTSHMIGNVVRHQDAYRREREEEKEDCNNERHL